jgi:uncharacterized repeat protein (TIGR01451 family)
LPYTRVLAAFMLATLISTLFAIPANAVQLPPTVTTTGPATAVLPSTSFQYTVLISNTSTDTDDTAVVLTDTLTNGTFVGTGSVVGGTGGTGCVAPVTPFVVATCNIGTIAIGTSATVTFTVMAPATVGIVTNDASVVDAVQVVPVIATDTTTVENADLQVTKTHTPAVVNPGDTFTYSIAVRNNGPSPATAVALTDVAPTGITFGFATVTIASSDMVAQTCPGMTATSLACTLSQPIAPGATVTFTVPATLAAGSTGPVSNTASVDSPTLELVTTNNSSTDVLSAATVDLAVGITVDPTTAAPGDTVNYTVTVTNPSTTTDATNVLVTDTLPTGLSAVDGPITPSAGTAAFASNVLTWNIPTVGRASATSPTTVTASFAATVDATVDPTTTPTITNPVNIVSATQTDPVLTDNTDSVDLTISGELADLNINTALSDAKVNQGDFIDITVSVVNNGPADATNVIVRNILPTGLKMGACAGCDQSGQLKGPIAGLRQSSQDIFLGTIANGETAQAILTVAVMASGGNLQNRARIVSLDQVDPNDTNDESLTQLITVGGASGNPGGGGSGGGTGGSGGGTGGTGGGTAFTGFTAGQLMPWFMLLFSLGLVAVEYARRTRLVSPIGSTYGFDPFQS